MTDRIGADFREDCRGRDGTWVKWYVGDTEVGYLYIAGTMEHVATISDGDNYDCSVYLGEQTAPQSAAWSVACDPCAN